MTHDSRTRTLATRFAATAGSLALLGATIVLGACGATTGSPGSSTAASAAGSAGGSSAATFVTITLTNAGCTPDRTTIVAGQVTFKVLNDGADKVSEVEIVRDGRILGEKENLAPGLSGTFALELAAGEYLVVCPGATVPETTLHVTAGAAAGTANPIDARMAAATSAYTTYVVDQVAHLVTTTKAFADAVIVGDVPKAKALRP